MMATKADDNEEADDEEADNDVADSTSTHEAAGLVAYRCGRSYRMACHIAMALSWYSVPSCHGIVL